MGQAQPGWRWGAVGLLGVLLLIAGAVPRVLGPVGTSRAQGGSVLFLPLALRDYDPTYVPPFGITMYGSVDEGAGLSKMQAAGAHWVVTVMSWRDIQPERGVWNWAAFDPKVQNAHAAGMRVLVLFHNNPPWAAPYPDGPVTDTQDLVAFIAAAAERYNGDGVDDAPGSPRVDAWTFYAEPDAGDPVRYPWKGHWGKQPERYAEMLTQVAPVIRARDPRALIANGGLAYDWFEEEGGPFVRDFLTRTLQALTDRGGVSRFLDAIAFHYYPISVQRWPTIREKAAEIRAIADRNGAAGLPLWVPEMGYWSSPGAGSSETRQAARLAQMFVRGMASDIRLMAWYAVFDAGPGTEEHGLFWGRDLNRPKQAYAAYTTVARELWGAWDPRPWGPEGVEGYRFRMPGGGEKIVLWARGSATSVDFPWACLRAVNTLGEVFDPVQDGDPNWDRDGQRNGQVRLDVFPDWPFYVAPRPCP
mgnify:FL=1